MGTQPVKDRAAGLVQGTLDMLILKTLALEAMHSYDIGARLARVSQGVFVVNPGSLFPAFRRLERSGLIRGEWRDTENNRRARYYSLTSRGRKRLGDETKHWRRLSGAIARVLEA
ncbi:MAG TPA: PadR family transcriptional regulator [Candidatus Polarisedimenticolia bacterium]|nr:PadR family transcriptional regulator [Candidatus Polarisedimenticolia bacterium]